MSLRSVTFLVPLELDCSDEEENDSETETAQSNQAASALFSETSESPPAAEPSSSGRASPIKQELHVSSAEPSEGSFDQISCYAFKQSPRDPNHKSADPTQRDSQFPSQCSSVGATSNVTMAARAVGSPQSRVGTQQRSSQQLAHHAAAAKKSRHSSTTISARSYRRRSHLNLFLF